MSDSEQKAFALGVFVATLMAITVAVLYLHENDSDWQREAIQHGAAEYDSATGAFKWKDGN